MLASGRPGDDTAVGCVVYIERPRKLHEDALPGAAVRRRARKTAAERTLPLFGLSAGDVLRVAAAAGVDPRTVRAVLDGRGSKLARTAVLDALRSENLGGVAKQVRDAEVLRNA